MYNLYVCTVMSVCAIAMVYIFFWANARGWSPVVIAQTHTLRPSVQQSCDLTHEIYASYREWVGPYGNHTPIALIHTHVHRGINIIMLYARCTCVIYTIYKYIIYVRSLFWEIRSARSFFANRYEIPWCWARYIEWSTVICGLDKESRLHLIP